MARRTGRGHTLAMKAWPGAFLPAILSLPVFSLAPKNQPLTSSDLYCLMPQCTQPAAKAGPIATPEEIGLHATADFLAQQGAAEIQEIEREAAKTRRDRTGRLISPASERAASSARPAESVRKTADDYAAIQLDNGLTGVAGPQGAAGKVNSLQTIADSRPEAAQALPDPAANPYDSLFDKKKVTPGSLDSRRGFKVSKPNP
jgi:hypothetical protein